MHRGGRIRCSSVAPHNTVAREVLGYVPTLWPCKTILVAKNLAPFLSPHLQQSQVAAVMVPIRNRRQPWGGVNPAPAHPLHGGYAQD